MNSWNEQKKQKAKDYIAQAIEELREVEDEDMSSEILSLEDIQMIRL